MTGSEPLEIRELSEGDGWLRLTLLGELDIASAPVLTRRPDQLRDHGQAVLMDLSQLEFMDSSGLRVIIGSIKDGSDGWRFCVDPNLAPQVRTLFRLTTVDQYVGT